MIFVRGVFIRCHSRCLFFQPGPVLIKAAFTTSPLLQYESQQNSKINPKHIVRSPGHPYHLPLISLDEYVWSGVPKWPKKIAIECGLSGRNYTFEEARTLTHKFAQCLLSIGFKKGNVLALLVPNIPEHPLIVLGATRAGLQVTLVNPIYTEVEISKQLGMCKANVVITTSSMYPKAKAAIAAAGRDIQILVVGYDDLPKVDPSCPVIEQMIEKQTDVIYKGVGHEKGFDPRHEIAVLPFSSGTSGAPKGVLLTHANLISNLIAMGHPHWTRARQTTATHQECFIVVVPLSHIYGLNAILLLGLSNGVKIVTLPKFDPKIYFAALIKHQPTVLHTVPAIMNFLLATNSINMEWCKRVHSVVCGGAPPGSVLIEKILTKFKEIGKEDVAYQEGYGMTETSPVITQLKPVSLKNKHLFGSCGQPLPRTECTVVKDGVSLGVGEIGEFYARGPQVMMGYLNNPDATKNTMDGDWIMTGDAARFDENGYFYIVERLKELIKVKGFPVSPTEIENALKLHPDILDVAVCGYPDDKMGEVPRAFVVLKENCSPKEEDIVNFLQGKLAEFKQLFGGVQFVSEIPRNANGKIVRSEVKKLYTK